MKVHVDPIIERDFSDLVQQFKEYAVKKNCGKIRRKISDSNNLAMVFYKSSFPEIDNIERNCDLILK